MKKFIEGILILILCGGCHKPVGIIQSHPLAPLKIHKVKTSQNILPSLIVYKNNKKTFTKPSVWNRKTHKFSEGMPEIIQVLPGDTLYKLSKKHSVPLSLFIEKNNIKPPFKINAGQSLVLYSPRLHIVDKNESLYSISKLHNVGQSTLVQHNKLKNTILKEGQILVLPASINQPKITKPQKNVTSRPVPAMDGKLFRWPVKGNIISKFGPQKQDLWNDGINIQGRSGQSIQAAQNGIIVYQGNGIKSFGNLILIKHDNQFVTAYAHLKSFNTQKGNIVKAGQSIGTIGTSGYVQSLQLHFEIRKGKKPLNPLLFLEK